MFKVGDRVRVITDRYGHNQHGLEGRVKSLHKDGYRFDMVVEGIRRDGTPFQYCYTNGDVERIAQTPFEEDLRAYIYQELGLS